MEKNIEQIVAEIKEEMQDTINFTRNLADEWKH